MKNTIKKSIAEQRWEKVSVNQVYHSFLKGEFNQCIERLGPFVQEYRGLIDNPDFENESQNCMRAILLCPRVHILRKIPFSTVWYKVSSLNESHFKNLHIINDLGWNDPNDKNELIKVVKRKPMKLSSKPAELEPSILFGHSKEGPFTIIEGNHRFTALASTTNIEFNYDCYIGLSKDTHPLHWPDCSG